MLEVMEEEELENLRDQQRHFQVGSMFPTFSKSELVSKWQFRKHKSVNNVQLQDWKSKNLENKKENDELLNTERYAIPELDRKW